ncbi:hypothetical protein THAOC_28791, partial [Thalassiosira oceanica]
GVNGDDKRTSYEQKIRDIAAPSAATVGIAASSGIIEEHVKKIEAIHGNSGGVDADAPKKVRYEARRNFDWKKLPGSGTGPPGTPQIQQVYGAMNPLLAYTLALMHLPAFHIPRASGKTTWEPVSTSTPTATPCFHAEISGSEPPHTPYGALYRMVDGIYGEIYSSMCSWLHMQGHR